MNQVKNFWKNYKDYYGSIIRLGIPILIGQLGMIVVVFADNIMVGRYSTEALASASFVNNVFNVANFACMGFTYGLTPLIGALFTETFRHYRCDDTHRCMAQYRVHSACDGRDDSCMA